MAAIERTGAGTWRGNLRGGNGEIETTSGVLKGTPFSFATRFENEKGTNPEELIAAAHAACFSMAFSNFLSQQGHEPDEIRTVATASLEDGRIQRMHLETTGKVAGLDAETFARLAIEAEQKCPVSNSYRNCIDITVNATLL